MLSPDADFACCECNGPSGGSLVCAPCRRALSPGAHARITEQWHRTIRSMAPHRDDLVQCFHCEAWFEEDLICGDHFPYTKGTRPDLRYHLGNGVACCARCNTSGARARKNWRLFVDRVA